MDEPNVENLKNSSIKKDQPPVLEDMGPQLSES